VAKAIEEGELIVISSIFETPETQKAHREGFLKYWCLPEEFEIKWDIRNTPGTIARIEAEAGAGVPISGDVTTMPAITWFMQAVDRGLIMAYESPEYEHMKLPERIGLNNRPYWTSDMYLFLPMWNSEALPGLEITSWLDLLKPELKGKMSLLDGSAQQSVALAYWFLKPRLPEDYWQKLAEQDLLISSTSLLSVEMMMSGERPLSILGVSADANVLYSQGATHVRTAVPKEGVMLQEQATAIFASAPHPNAAQLWVDFLRSYDGQVIFEFHEGRVPGREGVPSSNPMTPNADSLGEAAFAPDYRAMATDPELVKKAQEEFRALFVNR
jgi:iron(III) transport system substrate-binding protein